MNEDDFFSKMSIANTVTVESNQGNTSLQSNINNSLILKNIMKLSSLPFKIATFTASALSLVLPFKFANAISFDEFAVDQNKFIAVAVPYNYKKYKLAIIEQIPGQSACWQESGFNPTTVDLLLLNFDHTHACLKGVDTNGYSLRINGQDDKVAYLINLYYENGELQLIADHSDPNQPDLVLGRTYGIREAPMKIVLDPKWQFTKRLYQGKAIQHIYISNNPNPQILNNVDTSSIANKPTVTPTESSTQPTQQSTATNQPISSQTPSVTIPNTLPEFVSNFLTPLTEALYQTYNNLFAPKSNNTQPYHMPNTPDSSDSSQP